MANYGGMFVVAHVAIFGHAFEVAPQTLGEIGARSLIAPRSGPFIKKRSSKPAWLEGGQCPL